jgi:flagellin
MRINHNIAALNSYRQLALNNANGAKSLEKLSSGYRINRAGDDAAGLALSEKMRSQIKGLSQAQRNAQDGISLIQTAEGALAETHSILQRMRELVVQANNGTYSDSDRISIQQEISELIDEVDGIAGRTEFNGKNLLQGNIGIKADTSAGSYAAMTAAGLSFDVTNAEAGTTYTFSYVDDSNDLTLSAGGVSQTLSDIATANVISAGTTLNFDKLGITVTFASDTNIASDGDIAIDGDTLVTAADADKTSIQIGANKDQYLNIAIADMRAGSIGKVAANTLADVNVNSLTFNENLDIIDKAIEDVSAQRSNLGAYQNRLEHTINNLGAAEENLTASESRIRDVDMAKEMMEFTKNNILTQAATAMLAQANMLPQGVLQLLG